MSSMFNVAPPAPDAARFPRLAINSLAIIFAPLPCKRRKVLIVRLAGYTARIVTRDIAAGMAGRDAAVRSGNKPRGQTNHAGSHYGLARSRRDAYRRGRAGTDHRGAEFDRGDHLRSNGSCRAGLDHASFGRAWLACRRSGTGQNQARRNSWRRSRLAYAPRPVHAGFDARRYSRLRNPGRDGWPPARVSFRVRADLRPIADGRRNQPGKSQNPVGAAPGDAGISRLGCWRTARSTAPLSRARDAKSAGTRGNIPAARGPARSLSHANRCGLPRSRGRTQDA